MDIPDNAIPIDQFEAASSDALPAAIPVDQFEAASVEGPQDIPAGSIPVDQFESSEEAYGGVKNTLIAGAEGALKGVLGPLAPMAEKIAGVTYHDQRMRAEESPIAHGLGEAAGFIAPALLTGGLSAEARAAAEVATLPGIMGKAGEGAAALVGLGNLAKEASYAQKVGSATVKAAAEMAVMQGSDEVAKKVMNDPTASSEDAIAHMGLAAALGGGLGALGAGVISPLWSATAGPKVDAMLNMTKNYLNGGAKLAMGEAEEQAAKTLGIELSPAMRSGMSQDARANGFFSDLRRAEHPEILQGIQKTHDDISNSVMGSLNTTPQAVAEYSENEGGRALRDTLQNEIKVKYDPRAAQMQARDEAAAPLKIADHDRLDQAGVLLEKGLNTLGADSPYYKNYQHYAERLIGDNKGTIGEIDKLRTEIFSDMKKANRAGDDNTWRALSDIRNTLGDFQEKQIEKFAYEAGGKSADIIAKRELANREYTQYAKTMDTLMDHLGLGEFKGTKGVISKITEKLAPEDVFKKFTIKGNADLIPFLQANFPETLSKIIENERKQMLKPAILAAAKKGENPIDVKKLSEIINKNMSGRPEYVKAVLPEEAVKRVEAAKILSEAIPSPRDSGTPAGMAKLFRMMPANATAAISWAMGHGAIGGYMAGEMAQKLGKDAPEAIKLGYLKYLATDKPVKAEGFKAMVDFVDAAYKGEKMLSKAAAGVIKPGVPVLSPSQIPTHNELMKLDKLVAKASDNTDMLDKQDESDLGHYLPDHQTATTTASLTAVQYLQNLKPQPQKIGPLDKEIPPSPEQEARYQRALEIAQQPAIVLQHVKNGTLQTTDMTDLKSMFPSIYSSMADKLTNELAGHDPEKAPIPYKTRMSLSLFLGQPLDNSMQPMSIIAAQPKPKAPPPPMQGGAKGGKGAPSKLGKSNSSYNTPNQAAEQDRSKRD